MDRYMNAITDISINELNVHYLGSTKAILENPYKELNQLVLATTK
jgi:hypothetical protein